MNSWDQRNVRQASKLASTTTADVACNTSQTHTDTDPTTWAQHTTRATSAYALHSYQLPHQVYEVHPQQQPPPHYPPMRQYREQFHQHALGAPAPPPNLIPLHPQQQFSVQVPPIPMYHDQRSFSAVYPQNSMEYPPPASNMSLQKLPLPLPRPIALPRPKQSLISNTSGGSFSGATSVSTSTSTSSENGAHSIEHRSRAQYNLWTREDDELLLYLKDECHLGWNKISRHFNFRTASGCQFRWRRLIGVDKTIRKDNKKENSLKMLLN